MAGSTVLERTTEKDAVKTAQTEELSAAERQHNERRAEYLKLLYAEEEPELQAAPVVAAPASAAQRLADYKPYSAPASNHTLFDGITYKDGEIVSDVAVKTAPSAQAEVFTAPAPTARVEVMPAPVYAPAEEDALPTQRTMDTLRQNTAEVETARRTGLFAGISTRAKIALAAIVFAIVMAIVVICINTGIINRLDASIETLREEVAEEQMKYEALDRERQDILNFEGSIQDIVNQFAEENGMIRG